MNTKYLIILVVFLFSSCSRQTGKTETTQDTTQVESPGEDDSKIEDENGGAFDETAYATAEAQNQLNSFLDDFDRIKTSLMRVMYVESMEYDGKTTTYYYQDKRLAYVKHEVSAEGGYSESILVKVDPDFESVLSTVVNPNQSILAEGYFSFVKNGESTGFLVKGMDDGSFRIDGPTETQSIMYLNGIDEHFSKINESKNQFTVNEADGMYVLYIYRKKVESQYGEVEVTKSYQIDKDYFEKQL